MKQDFLGFLGGDYIPFTFRKGFFCITFKRRQLDSSAARLFAKYFFFLVGRGRFQYLKNGDKLGLCSLERVEECRFGSILALGSEAHIG